MLDVSALLARHRHARVYFDSNIFIYVLGRNPDYLPVCIELMQACANEGILGITGDVTLAELLAKPLKENDANAVATVRNLLVNDGAFSLIGHPRICFEQAAALRARHKLKLVDALHLATAIHAGAACFVSYDFQFPQMPEIECLTLD